MGNHPGTALRISSSLLVLSGYLALASVRTYSMLVLLIPIVAILFAPFGERLDARHAGYRVISRALTITYFCFIPLSAILLNMIDAVVMLTTYIQIYTLVHIKAERNYYHLYLMSFFILLAACVQAPEPIIAFVLLLYLVSAIWAFIALRIESDATQSNAKSSADIMGLHERKVQLVDRSNRIYDAGLIASICTVCMVAALLTVSIFYFTPRIEAGFLGNQAPVAASTGLSDEVNLDGGAFIQEDQTAVMHIRFPDEPDGRPSLGRLYWRVTSFARYQNGGWRREVLRRHLQPNVNDLNSRQMRHMGARSPLTLVRYRTNEENRRLHQQIYMDNVPTQGMPALDLVQQIDINGSPRRTRVNWDDALDFTVKLTTAGPRQMTYDAWSEVIQNSPDDLRGASMNFGFLTSWDRDVLTYHELLPETVALAAEITAPHDTLYDKCVAVQTYLSRAPFEYTLDVPLLPANNGIDAFINEIQRGHCELFASAMALMLRSQGIPTRVVSGYAGGEYNESDGGFTVRQSMAHLWLEVLFPGIGWVRFDPSPPSSDVAPSTMQQIARFVSSARLRAGMFWYQEVVGFDSGLQIERFRDLSTGFIKSFQFGDENSGVNMSPDAGFRVPVGWLIVFTLAVMASSILIFRSRQRTRAQLALLTPEQIQASKLYHRIRRKLARIGINPMQKTAEDLLSEAQTHPAVNPEAATEVLEAYNEIRFGMRPLPTERWKALNARIRMLLRDTPEVRPASTPLSRR